MGSEKKRKRVTADEDGNATPLSEDKAERKRLKKLKKEAAAAAAAAAEAAAQPNGGGAQEDGAEESKSNKTDIVPLLSPIASRMFIFQHSLPPI